MLKKEEIYLSKYKKKEKDLNKLEKFIESKKDKKNNIKNGNINK